MWEPRRTSTRTMGLTQGAVEYRDHPMGLSGVDHPIDPRNVDLFAKNQWQAPMAPMASRSIIAKPLRMCQVFGTPIFSIHLLRKSISNWEILKMNWIWFRFVFGTLKLFHPWPIARHPRHPRHLHVAEFGIIFDFDGQLSNIDDDQRMQCSRPNYDKP